MVQSREFWFHWNQVWCGMDLKFSNIDATSQTTIAVIVEDSLKKLNAVLPLSQVEFLVAADQSQVIPEWGVGGYCASASSIELIVELNRQDDWQNYLPRTIFHEWHHLARWRGPGYGQTLMEALISEGLAQHFEVEVGGCEPAFFSIFLDPLVRKQMLGALRREISDTAYDHNRWFFGKGEFPFQAGYDLGFHITDLFMKSRKKRPSELIQLNSSEMENYLFK